MTETILSLVSILLGIMGAVLIGALNSKISFGITGNVIVGVFTSVFVVKTFGRLGFAPNDIITNQQINYLLLLVNVVVSILAGALGLLACSKIKKKLF